MKKLFFNTNFNSAGSICNHNGKCTMETTQLTDNGGFDGYPQINNSGHVVWHSTGGSDNGVR